jgi:hypothetical protein
MPDPDIASPSGEAKRRNPEAANTPKGILRRPSCYVLPLIFVLLFGWCFLAGGDGILFACMLGFPTLLLTKLFQDAESLVWQWTIIFVCGYAQWLLVNFLILKGIDLIKRWMGNQKAN